jgi:uncharacterized protein YprB with RNaseH-like and TPR domain
MRDLSARLREIVRQDPRPRVTPMTPHAAARSSSRGELTYVPDPDGGEGRAEAGDLSGHAVRVSESCVAVDRVYAADCPYGRRSIGAWAPVGDSPLHLLDARISPGADWSRRVVFFDIETTGLSSGAGTLAFLAGCGWFEHDGFHVRQFFLAGPAGERAMLDALAEVLADASLLVTYNGRTFDVPFMEMRSAFHRVTAPAGGVPHVDMLPSARRLWGRREAAAPDQRCSLSALERDVLGVQRVADVPSFEIPARYFHFLRTGLGAVIEPVLEHNRCDLVSLAALMAHVLWMAREGPEACREPAEQLALGRLYERGGQLEAARRSFEMAVAGCGDPAVRRDALVRLAAGFRRQARHEEAARAWEEVLSIPSAQSDRSPAVDRLAIEALAIHHEHRRKDLAAARRYAEALRRKTSERARADIEHRLRRIDRKLNGTLEI